MSDFGTATLDLFEKASLRRFFEGLVPKPIGFWNKPNYLTKIACIVDFFFSL